MAKELALIVAPHESRHPFTRGGISYEAVKGIDKDGMGYAYLEEVGLIDGLLKARLYFTRLDVTTKINKVGQASTKGALESVNTYWERCLEHPTTGVVYQIQHNIPCHFTNKADLIFFCGTLGLPILGNILNGAVRGEIMGFNDQPIIDIQGSWIQDTTLNADGTVDTTKSYDTSKPADKTAYAKVQPTYIGEDEVVAESSQEPSPEEPVTEEPTPEPPADETTV
jgi:hypothetical protein